MISIPEGTKNRQGIVLVRGNLETHWKRSPLLLTRGYNGAKRTHLFARYHSSQKMPQSHLTAAIYNTDLGADYFDKLDTTRIQRHHVQRLEQLGYTVTLTPKVAV